MIASSIEEHERFVKSLEKNGSSSGMNGDEWSLIAKDMNWSVDNVKLYAYWYMQQLQRVNDDGGSGGSGDNGGIENSVGSSTSSSTTCKGKGPPLNKMDVDKTEPNENCNDKDKDNAAPSPAPSASISMNDNEWTYEESILFDTLSMTYDSSEMHRWERVASLIPNKDQKQCQQRWERLCKMSTDAGSTTG